jgi:hypothetical protein
MTVRKVKKPSDSSSAFNKLKPDLRATIEEALKLGNLSIVPPRNDGSKKPYPFEWKPFQVKKASKKQLAEWYQQGLTGFGIVCGAISDNLECLDFDNKDIFRQFCQCMRDMGLTDLLRRLKSGYWESTPNGAHLFYRCSEIGGNTKLATRPKRRANEIQR